MTATTSGKATMKIKDDDTGEGTIEFEGTYVFVNGVKIAKRKDNKWVSLLPGVTVSDLKKKGKKGRAGIEIIYSGPDPLNNSREGSSSK